MFATEKEYRVAVSKIKAALKSSNKAPIVLYGAVSSGKTPIIVKLKAREYLMYAKGITAFDIIKLVIDLGFNNENSDRDRAVISIVDVELYHELKAQKCLRCFALPFPSCSYVDSVISELSH
ncbi:hypothetical protein Q4519_05010 [Motilimonas sp. 1_MG-2023]|uniref:hypothetical protein n=1 Tax=Motilimonas sp. 1_MG-2023 TaxID=3062672 RepID=UPI0026E28E5D|nr:hypothetical protein [Motilimonas sp. 1_MG-2023]MDO6525039.1 hypothetical protein [Motilimonas sp. 1_MG-2023]